MTGISDFGRVIADQVAGSVRSFGDQLAQSIARQGSGGWEPGPLWDKAILSMRTEGGSLAQNLENLRTFAPELFEQLSPELRALFGDQLAGAKHVFDEIHTDRGGEFAQMLLGFKEYGAKVDDELQVLVRKADEANASAARVSVEGAQVLDWSLADDGHEAVKVAERAAENVQAAAAGGGGPAL